ncbi:PREDICTED: uncharacterized protein LOC104733780 [Camelina sativa]|uniref:Uncharacterized protein LOC104733780 n=1 Tax=Camelina sativa TaxID=90675 RepID=A0ABM0V6I3_CAMSA|nr:PREDICTED: uncharacterized protein LOC104733780 [Camelina sativa]
MKLRVTFGDYKCSGNLIIPLSSFLQAPPNPLTYSLFFSGSSSINGVLTYGFQCEIRVCVLSVVMTVAEPHMELNQETKQLDADKLSPKKEQSPRGEDEECGLPSANTSEETVTSVSGGEELDVDIVESDENKTSTTDEDPNATEYSSSFSDTEYENADMLLMSNFQIIVVSYFCLRPEFVSLF